LNRFLVIQTASIGDVILGTTVLESLHISFPEAMIDILIKDGNQGLFLDHPFVNESIIWEKSSKKYRNLFRIIRRIRKKKYDVVFNIQRFLSTGVVTWLSGAGTRVGFDKNPLSFTFDHKINHLILPGKKFVHEVDRNNSLLKELEISTTRIPKLYPSKKDFERVNQYQSSEYICIAPASLWFTKQYPVEKWIEFIKEVPEQLRVYLLGSASDRHLCENIIEESGRSNVASIAGDLTLLQTAALMSGSKMNYVNDSAPQHLASSVDAPVTTIYCSTIPAFGFGPLSRDSEVVETKETLNCRPCGLHGLNSCPEGHFRCAFNINRQQLLNRIRNERGNNQSNKNT